MYKIEAAHGAAHSKAVIYSGFAFLISAVCLLASGCRDVRTIWLAQSKSPDGQWLASAKIEEHGGPGNAGIQTLVSIEPTDRSASPEVVLALSPTPGSEPEMKNLEMRWLAPMHLEIRYSGNAIVDFEVVKVFGIDITYGLR
jgi:hypothetical protein